jgi:hypothetical protein
VLSATTLEVSCKRLLKATSLVYLADNFTLDFRDREQYFLTILKIVEYINFLVDSFRTNEQAGYVSSA